MTEKKLAKEIKSAVDWLVKENCGCSTITLDDRLAVCVGWSDGYDKTDPCIIHATDGPTWGITAGIKVWTADDMRTDFDWLVSPFSDDDVWTTDICISPNENYEQIARYFLDEYEALSKLEIRENGRIEKLDEEDYEEKEKE